MNTYEWIISKLEVIPKVGDLENYVVKCHWRYNATNGTIIKDSYGLVSFEEIENPENYVPYESLTKEIIESWLEGSMDVEAMKAELDTKIEDEINTPIVSMELPW